MNSTLRATRQGPPRVSIRWIWLPAFALSFFGIRSTSVLAQPAATVVLDEARYEPVEQMRRVTGQVRAARRSRLASQEEGWLIELLAREGDRVEQGQVVARFDDERSGLRVAEARAMVRAASARLRQFTIESDRASRERDRIANLADQGIAGAQEADDAESAAASADASRQSAESDLAAAEAALALAERRFRDTEIRAPFTGVVISLSVEIGEWVDIGGQVLELVETDQLEIWADIPERLVARVRTHGTTIGVQSDAAAFEGIGTDPRIVPAADPLSRIFPLRMRVDARGTDLLPGMSADAYIPTGTALPTLSVHKDAILRDDAGLFVYFAVPYSPQGESQDGASYDWQAAPARVERLFGFGDRVAVRGSLPRDAKVVVQGNERMFPSQPMIVSTPAEATCTGSDQVEEARSEAGTGSRPTRTGNNETPKAGG